MTIDPETLMAYADGELDPIAAKRVERAIAADPALAEQVDQHRALTTLVRDTFAPITTRPVPAGIEAMVHDAARIVPLAPRPASAPRSERHWWMGAVAASLVAGLFAGPLILPAQSDGGIALEQGRAVAGGTVAHALDTQLAAAQASDAPVRIGVSFRDGANRLCRSFETGETGGIACAQGRDWRLVRLYDGVTRQETTYRQAGSAAAAMMADAQAMMAGEPLDAKGEAAALRSRR